MSCIDSSVRWYVRDADGKVFGPFSKDNACSFANDIEGGLFPETIFEAPPPQIVRISVEGGVADVEECPAGVEVIIKDYDGDGVDDERLEEDERGDYLESHHGGDS